MGLRSQNAMLRQELQDALLGTALKFGDALRLYERRRQRRGFDYRCRRLLDEAHLSGSLLLVLADEVGGRRAPVSDRALRAPRT